MLNATVLLKMEIVIYQNSVSVKDKFQIFIDGNQRHHATYKLLSLLSEISLFEWDSELPKVIINKRFHLFNAIYDLSLSDGNVLNFKTISFLKDHFQCISNFDVYDIYANRGRKYSVYKNGNQIAWWTKDLITWLEGDSYKIIADNDCDYNLIISFCLIIDNYKSQRKRSLLNINLPKLFFEAKKFDTNWTSKG
jgi:uncharacterized protein YxjI